MHKDSVGGCKNIPPQIPTSAFTTHQETIRMIFLTIQLCRDNKHLFWLELIYINNTCHLIMAKQYEKWFDSTSKFMLFESFVSLKLVKYYKLMIAELNATNKIQIVIKYFFFSLCASSRQEKQNEIFYRRNWIKNCSVVKNKWILLNIQYISTFQASISWVNIVALCQSSQN